MPVCLYLQLSTPMISFLLAVWDRSFSVECRDIDSPIGSLHTAGRLGVPTDYINVHCKALIRFAQSKS